MFKVVFKVKEDEYFLPLRQLREVKQPYGIYIETCRKKRVAGKFKLMVASLTELKLYLLVVIDEKCFLSSIQR